MNRHGTIRTNTARALVRYLGAQQVEIEGNLVPMFAGVWAIFGHCNVAGLGEALYGIRDHLQTYRAHNEQTMAHAAIAFAKASHRRRIMACTSSIGRGATNMVTAAAVAHVNRLPVLFLPSSRVAACTIRRQQPGWRLSLCDMRSRLPRRRPASRHWRPIIAQSHSRTSVIIIDTDPAISTSEGGRWWDVAVPEISTRASVRDAHAAYVAAQKKQILE